MRGELRRGQTQDIIFLYNFQNKGSGVKIGTEEKRRDKKR